MVYVVATSTLKNIRVSPQKLNLVAAAIRQKRLLAAVDYLTFCPKRVSADVLKALRSATANALEREQCSIDDLIVSEAYVNKGTSLGRIRPRAKGRAGRIHKPFSHLKLSLARREV
jgi:large subunit ribosomal protein L22